MGLYMKFLAMHVKRRMAYKKSFFMSVAGRFLISFTVFLWLWFLLDRFETIGGYNLGECLLCSGVMLSAFALSECFFRGFDRFSRLVRTARFDRLMLRPRGLVFQVLCDEIEFDRVGSLLQGLFMLALGAARSGAPIGPYRALVIALMVIGGAVVFSALYLLKAGLCFFTLEGLEFMNVFTDGARDYGAYPVDVYGQRTLTFCTFVIPYALFQYYPLMYVLGRRESPWLGLLPLVSALFVLPCLAVWRLGVRKYKSAGS